MTEPQKSQRILVRPGLAVLVAVLGGIAAVPATRPLLVVLAFVVILMVVHTSAMTLAAVSARTPVEEVSLFMGPKLVSLLVGRTRLVLGGLPFGSYVRLSGVERTEEPPSGFAALSLPWRLFITAAGVAALFLLSCLCIGWSKAGREMLTGFEQVLRGAFAPVSYGAPLLQEGVTIFRTQGFLPTLGILAAKFAAFNLLPVPLLNGGALLMELFRTRLSIETTRRLYNAGLLVLLLNLGWAIAMINFLLGHR